MKTRPNTERARDRMLLTPQQQLERVVYIERYTRRGLPPLRETIQTFAESVAKYAVYIAWVSRFFIVTRTRLPLNGALESTESDVWLTARFITSSTLRCFTLGCGTTIFGRKIRTIWTRRASLSASRNPAKECSLEHFGHRKKRIRLSKMAIENRIRY